MGCVKLKWRSYSLFVRFIGVFVLIYLFQHIEENCAGVSTIDVIVVTKTKMFKINIII